MNKIEDKTKAIRDFLNHPWKKSILWRNRIAYTKTFASLDAIEDSQEAIIAFKKTPEFDAFSGGYLYIYGLMQSLFVQQDAINSLHIALFNDAINRQEYPKLGLIREHRRLTVGHPTNAIKGKQESFTYIARGSISKNKFEYLKHVPNNTHQSIYEKVNINETLEIQEENIITILSKIYKSIEIELNNHKTKFMNQKLTELVSNNNDYYFQKLATAVGKKDNLAELGLNGIVADYEKIKSAILQRYDSTFGVSGIELNFEYMDFLIERLQRDLVDNQIKDQKELYIFIDALKRYFNELIEMCKEIDKEFS